MKNKSNSSTKKRAADGSKKPAPSRMSVAKTKAKSQAKAGVKKAAKKTAPLEKTVLKTKAWAAAKKAARKAAAKPAARKTVAVKKARGTPVAKSVSLVHTAPAIMASGVFNRIQSAPFNADTVLAHSLPRPSSSSKPRLLWIGDALVPTGFATVTHSVLDHLHHDWAVTVSGVNYDGSSHKLPYQALPARQGGDMWGMDRFRALCAELDPAAVIINNDWWNVAKFAKIAPAGVPVIGYMPVDGGGIDPAAMRLLNKLHAAVWYTDYGHREAAKAGFSGTRHIIPHGIDTSLFTPMDRLEARNLLDLNVPKNAFIVGNLNRNQPRKRLDLTIEIFASWVKSHRVTNAFLLLHCAQKDSGWDLRRIAAHHGIADRLLCTGGENMRAMQDVRHLQLIYNSLDVQMTTTLGEGWGLTTMEGMACGIPQIVPDSAALAEWAVPAVKIPCSRTLWHPEITTSGALVDHEPFVAALDALYRSKAERVRLGEEGIRHVRRPEFRWSNVARRFHALAASAASPASKKPQHA